MRIAAFAVALLGLIVTATTAIAFDGFPGIWSGSVSTKKQPLSHTVQAHFLSNSDFSLTVLQPGPSYTYKGHWAYAGNKMSLTFSRVSPSSAANLLWPVGDKEIPIVYFDAKDPRKVSLRFEGDPWVMTLFKLQ